MSEFTDKPDEPAFSKAEEAENAAKSGVKSDVKADDAPKSNTDGPKSIADEAKPAESAVKSSVPQTTEEGTAAPTAKSDADAEATKSKATPDESTSSNADVTKSNADASKTTVDAVHKSSMEPGKSAVKSGIAATASKAKSGVVASKSKIKSELKATKSKSKSEVKATKSKSSNKRTSSKVEAQGSRSSQSGARSKVSDLSEARIGFVGSGRMTEAIVKGLLKSEKVKPKQLFVSAKTSKNLDTFKVQGIATSTRAYDIFGKFDCDLIFIAVHGYVVRNCFKLGGTRPLALTTNFIPSRKRPTYILSLIGGVDLPDLKACLLNPETSNRYQVEIHRIVLNTSVAYGLGLGALDVEIDSKQCSPLVRDLLNCLAKIETVASEQMDAVCAVAGNGTAFVYYFISALADGGFKMGLNKVMATKLATKTMQCAALSILQTGKGLAELRDESTSPSGGAIYGIHVLEKQDCTSGIQAAIEASYRRLKELVEVAN